MHKQVEIPKIVQSLVLFALDHQQPVVHPDMAGLKNRHVRVEMKAEKAAKHTSTLAAAVIFSASSSVCQSLSGFLEHATRRKSALRHLMPVFRHDRVLPTLTGASCDSLLSIFQHFELCALDLTLQAHSQIHRCSLEIEDAKFAVREASTVRVEDQRECRASIQFCTSTVSEGRPASWLLDEMEAFLSALSFWNPHVGFSCADYSEGELVVDLQ